MGEPEAQPGTDLSIISTRDLTKELVRRHDCGAFVAMQIDYGGNGRHALARRWWGSAHAVAGLCLEVAMAAITEFARTASSVDGRGEMDISRPGEGDS